LGIGLSPTKKSQTIDEYIAHFPKNTQDILEEIRQAIKEAAPQAEETISYQIPAFSQNGILVWFGAYKKHISFFPRANVVEVFQDELSGFKTSKGTIQFPLDKPIPMELIKKIVRFRVKENLILNENKN
jgi:uncharacterized protein YdhG (YjbR/CyaY superfamily)